MPDLSDTDVYLEFAFEDAFVLEGIINRIHAPLIVEEISFRLPFESKTALMRNELQINDVKKGDIAYMPLGDALVIYLEDMHTYSQVNILGKITSPAEQIALLRNVKRGSQVEVRKSKQS